FYPAVGGFLSNYYQTQVTGRFIAAQFSYTAPSGFSPWGEPPTPPPPPPPPFSPHDQEADFNIVDESVASFISEIGVTPTVNVLPGDWLRRDDAQRVVLVEMDYMIQTLNDDAKSVPEKKTLYLANWPYDNDTKPWRDCIRATPRYKRSLNRATLRGSYS